MRDRTDLLNRLHATCSLALPQYIMKLRRRSTSTWGHTPRQLLQKGKRRLISAFLCSRNTYKDARAANPRWRKYWHFSMRLKRPFDLVYGSARKRSTGIYQYGASRMCSFYHFEQPPDGKFTVGIPAFHVHNAELSVQHSQQLRRSIRLLSPFPRANVPQGEPYPRSFRSVL